MWEYPGIPHSQISPQLIHRSNYISDNPSAHMVHILGGGEAPPVEMSLFVSPIPCQMERHGTFRHIPPTNSHGNAARQHRNMLSSNNNDESDGIANKGRKRSHFDVQLASARCPDQLLRETPSSTHASQDLRGARPRLQGVPRTGYPKAPLARSRCALPHSLSSSFDSELILGWITPYGA